MLGTLVLGLLLTVPPQPGDASPKRRSAPEDPSRSTGGAARPRHRAGRPRFFSSLGSRCPRCPLAPSTAGQQSHPPPISHLFPSSPGAVQEDTKPPAWVLFRLALHRPRGVSHPCNKKSLFPSILAIPLSPHADEFCRKPRNESVEGADGPRLPCARRGCGSTGRFDGDFTFGTGRKQRIEVNKPGNKAEAYGVAGPREAPRRPRSEGTSPISPGRAFLSGTRRGGGSGGNSLT